MFGYIKPLECELKVKDKALYDAAYCGLCRTLGKEFGQTARAVLSFDCTFIAMLAASASDMPKIDSRLCAYKPFRKKRPCVAECAAFEFAAAANIILARYKLLDDKNDEKRLLPAVGAAILKGKAENAAKKYPGVEMAVKKGIGEISDIEREKCTDIDKPCDAFARLMRNVAASAPVEDEGSLCAIKEVAYHMGRWVYVADAWDDIEKDKKSGAYNPFATAGVDSARAEFLMNISLNEAQKAYDLLEPNAFRGVLDNIMYIGCRRRSERLLGGKGTEGRNNE